MPAFYWRNQCGEQNTAFGDELKVSKPKSSPPSRISLSLQRGVPTKKEHATQEFTAFQRNLLSSTRIVSSVT
jgi:hypothetical protein